MQVRRSNEVVACGAACSGLCAVCYLLLWGMSGVGVGAT